MKQFRANKLLGIAVGERSLTVAEVVLGADKPDVRRLGEFTYPDGAGLQNAAALGSSLAQFLREKKFASKSVIIGLPTKWVIAKPKEVPPSDATVAAGLLRLQAEGDFSSELKDLIYDYVGEADSAKPKTVLLMATASKYVEQAKALCEGARLELLGVTVSAATLGAVTGRAIGADSIVLSLAASGSELSAQTGGATSVLRHLRGPTPQAPFVNEVRRAVSLLPSNGTSAGREMIVWDGTVDDPTAGPVDQALHTALGLKVRRCDLSTLGVTTAPAAGNGAGNGTGRRYAAAVALALAASTGTLPVDFLHSRLAPPDVSRIPKWATWAIIAVVVCIAASIFAYQRLDKAEKDLKQHQEQAAKNEPLVKAAELFNAKVSFAQAWHGGDPRYLAVLRELTRAIPEDNLTYATSLNLRETPRPSGASSDKPATDERTLTGNLSGKTNDQQRAIQILDQIKGIKTFKDCKSGGVQAIGKEFSFSITFTYTPPPATAAAPAAPAPAVKK